MYKNNRAIATAILVGRLTFFVCYLTNIVGCGKSWVIQAAPMFLCL